MNNEYHFVTHWQIRGTPDEVYELISKPLNYPIWWPSVYLATTPIAAAETNAAQPRTRYHTKGWLPYTLRWESAVTEAIPPRRLVIRATGDFDGRGIWTFEP